MSDPFNNPRTPPSSDPERSTGPRPRTPSSDVMKPPGTAGGLKLVTISPADIESSSVTSAADLYAGADPYVGCTIDERYLVEALIGEGGMGVVYRCRHKIIGKTVAMKVLRADLARDGELTERFLNEARSASAIGNPHIIDISDFGRLPDGSTYFVMEFLDGSPLSLVVEGGKPVPVPRILNISRQLAEGLAAAHNAEIVHRDLKPDNIFLVVRGKEKDFIKILDFGIAKVSSQGGGKLTRAGAVFGTPHYMSPEQAAGAPVDHRGDVYSLGVILYEMASGRVPFDADNFMGILTQHMYKAPVPIRALVPEPQEVPPGLEAVVLKCLSKRPEHRYQTMEELVADIEKLREGMIPDAVPEMMARSGGFNVPADYFKKAGTMPAPVPATPLGLTRPKTRWPLYVGLAGLLATVVIVVAIFVGSRASDASMSASAVNAPAHPKSGPEVAPQRGAENLVVTRQVALAVEPLDAHVFRDGHDLGQSPIVLEVAEGTSIKVDVRREGYKELTLSLDGSEGRRSVKLERLAQVQRPSHGKAEKPAAKAEPATKPKGKQKSGLSGGEIVDPWGN